MMPLLSIIITAHQAENTIQRALSSVLDWESSNQTEIIVVDDASTDRTCELVRAMQKQHPQIVLRVLERNTGGPSVPRNTGIAMASGKYVTFLDDDDELVMPNLISVLTDAEERQADFVKGYLICEENGQRREANRLPVVPQGKEDTLQQMIRSQSTTQDFLVRRSLLLEHGIQYPRELNIGEDTVFILSILRVAENPAYVDRWFYVYHKTAPAGNGLSATRHWGDREVVSQLQAWRTAEHLCNQMGLSYFSLRLPAALRNLLIMLVRCSDGISEETCAALCSFVLETRSYTQNAMNLSSRYQQLFDALLTGDYKQFCTARKLRLLIAGCDLKFIMPVLPYLKEEYEIRVDEWTGHNTHDAHQSEKCAAWADIIWCEWLLGNAVYYCARKNANQWLVIRAHRFELSREFGFQVDYSRVDAFFAVGYYYLEQLVSRFTIPPEKTRLLSNYVEPARYCPDKEENDRYHIGLIGALPKRKGLMKALRLLNRLVKQDDRFRLHIMGKRPQEVSWVHNNPDEAAYYQECDAYAREQGLTPYVIWGGYRAQEELYRDIGYVVSLSDSEAPESFHLALAEGACAGCVGLTLPWPGVEFLYPREIVCRDEADIADRITGLSRNPEGFRAQSALLRQYVTEQYGVERFVQTLTRYLRQIRS